MLVKYQHHRHHAIPLLPLSVTGLFKRFDSGPQCWQGIGSGPDGCIIIR